MVTDTLSGEEFEKVVQSFKSTRESFRNILATMKPLAEINWENLIGRMDKVMGESDNVIGNCKVWAADKRLWAAARPKDIEIVESEFADFKKWVSDLESIVSLAIPVSRSANPRFYQRPPIRSPPPVLSESSPHKTATWGGSSPRQRTSRCAPSSFPQ